MAILMSKWQLVRTAGRRCCQSGVQLQASVLTGPSCLSAPSRAAGAARCHAIKASGVPIEAGQPLISWLSYRAHEVPSRCLCADLPSSPPMATESPYSAGQRTLSRPLRQPLAGMDSYDAILVLAGGQTADGGVPAWVERRLDCARDLYVHMSSQGRNVPVLCLGGGTPHKPPVTLPGGYVLHESTSCTHYLAERGVSPAHMLKEVSSYDTVGNAYFSLTIHALPANWRRVAVITSDFHMPRTRDLFEASYGLAGRQLWGQADRFTFSFLGVTDEGLFSDEVLEARLVKEAASQASWRKTASSLASLPDLHQWLHATHMCYAVSRQQEWGKKSDLDPRLLASY